MKAQKKKEWVWGGFPSFKTLFPKFSFSPEVDYFETDDEAVVTMELPGVRKEDIKLRVTESGLNIGLQEKTEKEDEKQAEGFYSHYKMSRFQGWREWVSFSSGVDASRAKATFKNGVLEVRVPKLVKSKGRELRVD